MTDHPTAGEVFTVKYPFILEDYTEWDEDGPSTFKSWVPGARFVASDAYGEESRACANGEGQMELTVVDVHKPGRFPTRVFFTRKWVDPKGRRFGKSGLHIMTLDAFRRRAKGYWHHYEIEADE